MTHCSLCCGRLGNFCIAYGGNVFCSDSCFEVFKLSLKSDRSIQKKLIDAHTTREGVVRHGKHERDKDGESAA